MHRGHGANHVLENLGRSADRPINPDIIHRPLESIGIAVVVQGVLAGGKSKGIIDGPVGETKSTEVRCRALSVEVEVQRAVGRIPHHRHMIPVAGEHGFGLGLDKFAVPGRIFLAKAKAPIGQKIEIDVGRAAHRVDSLPDHLHIF